jgi:thioesterase domain-containing protein
MSGELHNLYGPTEAAIDVTYWQCSRADNRGYVPIGRPISNVRVYVLDSHLGPTPIDVAGELYLGGVGIARGYLGCAGLTGERFVADPFTESERLYRSGDLARWRPDGTLEYLGRLDQQVKLRGFRIELGEIEAALRTHLQVREAVVLAREDSPGDHKLVAYVVPALSEITLTSRQLRAHLKSKLPDYMVPAAIVLLDGLPLTANGKLDRGALPAPTIGGTHLQQYEAPEGETEVALANIWQELLGTERVGRHDDFFELGGHSLLLVRLAAEVRIRLGVNLSIASLYRSPSVAGLGAQVARDGGRDSLLVSLNESGSAACIFLFHPVGGQVYHYSELARRLERDFRVYAVQSPEAAGMSTRFGNVGEMVAAYCSTVTNAQPDGPYRLLGWSTGGVVAMAVAETLNGAGHEVQYLGMIDTQAAVDRADDRLAFEVTLSSMRSVDDNARKVLDACRSLLSAGLSIDRMLEFDSDDPALVDLRAMIDDQYDRNSFTALLQQAVISRHYLHLLSEYRPARLQTAAHMIRSSDSVALNRADGLRFSHTDHIVADHYSILREPQANVLADAIRKAANGQRRERTWSDASMS